MLILRRRQCLVKKNLLRLIKKDKVVILKDRLKVYVLITLMLPNLRFRNRRMSMKHQLIVLTMDIQPYKLQRIKEYIHINSVRKTGK